MTYALLLICCLGFGQQLLPEPNLSQPSPQLASAYKKLREQMLAEQSDVQLSRFCVSLPPTAWPQYQELRLSMLLEEPAAFGGAFEEEVLYEDVVWANYLAEAATESRTILRFFLKDSEIVGMAGAKLGQTMKTRHKAMLFSVYVLPNYRSQGIAKKLINEVIGQLREKNIRKLEAFVSANQTSALNLYQGLNFSIEGCLKKYWLVDGKYVDAYAIALEIEPLNYLRGSDFIL